MNSESNAVPGSPRDSQLNSKMNDPQMNDSQRIASALSPTRPLYWSVRRELWEHRSIYIAPLIAAAVDLFGFLIGAIGLPHRMRAIYALDPEKQRNAIVMPYHLAMALIIGTAFIVGFYYCLDALYGERRDRSILFWKSLPVSDLTTVLSKLCTIVILQVFSFALVVATQLIMALVSSLVLAGSGQSVAPLWAQLSLFQGWLMLLYHLLTVHTLWYAPIYCWLLLVSAWSRRAPILWAVLPLAAIGILEKIAFNTMYFGDLMKYRFTGGQADGMTSMGMDTMAQISSGRFLGSPGLWIGLLLAAAFLFGAVRLRRYREPL